MPHRYSPVPLAAIDAFVKIVRRLRRECPWDRSQTHRSIRHSLIEETYEVIEALDGNDMAGLRTELGDLLLHVVMHAVMAEQEGVFTLREVVEGISDKLVRRHPHVFGKERAGDADAVLHAWERLKMQEGRRSVLEGVPKGMPSLQRALRVQERAAKVGFDWKTKSDVWKKVREEGEEVRHALDAGDRRAAQEEFGDYLFALVNYARVSGLNPENALRATVEKFIRRFEYIEKGLRRRGREPHQSTLEEMDGLWNEAKRSSSRRRKTPRRGGVTRR